MRVASLAWLPSKGNGKNKGTPVDGYRMHTHFEILRDIPERIDATAVKPKGQDDEKAVLASVLKPERCYVTDRGYAKFELFNQINAISSSCTCRARDNSTPKILKDRELTEADRAAGVVIDREVVLGAHAATPRPWLPTAPFDTSRLRSPAMCVPGEAAIIAMAGCDW